MGASNTNLTSSEGEAVLFERARELDHYFTVCERGAIFYFLLKIVHTKYEGKGTQDTPGYRFSLGSSVKS